jgi:hypothetical protein
MALETTYSHFLTSKTKKVFVNMLDAMFAVLDHFEDYRNFQLLYHSQIQPLDIIPKTTVVSAVRNLLTIRVQDLQDSIH